MAIITKEIQNLLQLRVKNEEFNSKTYKAMSNWLSLKGYNNASKLWDKYSKEELIHKSWVENFLLDLNILPLEQSQEQPQTEFKSLPNIVALSYQREIKTTDECQLLVKLCLDMGDYLTLGLAQRYIAEQVEEINKFQSIIDQIELFGDSEVALRLLDNWIKDKTIK